MDALQRALADEPAFRLDQVWEWTARGAGSYEEMTNLPASLRARLADEVPFSSLETRHEARSSDGTVKALFATHDGRPVEAVLMKYRDGRRSICLSSQSGCPLTCTFCATGQMRFGRNLTASEILDQALHLRRIEPLDHAVFMGMGEPMINIDAVLAACERLPSLGITHRRTAISTVGWIPGIERLTDCDMPIRLALSLHAPDDALRSELMPVNDRYPLADVLDACRRHHERRRRMVFVEYVMLDGVNDRYEQALALARLLDPRIYKVNLIPFNPTGSRYCRVDGRGDRDVPRGARGARRPHDGAVDARTRHRRGLRPARGKGRRRRSGLALDRRLQAGEAVVPFALDALQPQSGGAQRGRLQAVGEPAPLALAAQQAGLLERVYVFGHRLSGHRQLRGQSRHRDRSVQRGLDDLPPRRVGQRSEHRAEWIGGRHRSGGDERARGAGEQAQTRRPAGGEHRQACGLRLDDHHPGTRGRGDDQHLHAGRGLVVAPPPPHDSGGRIRRFDAAVTLAVGVADHDLRTGLQPVRRLDLIAEPAPGVGNRLPYVFGRGLDLDLALDNRLVATLFANH